MTNQIDYEEIRQIAEKRVKKRAKFYNDVRSYLSTNVVLWGIWFFLTGRGYPWPMWISVPWGIALVFQFFDLFVQTRVSTEDAIQREMDRELRSRGLSPEDLMEKPKRGRELQLSDDGELVPVDSYDEDVESKKRQEKRRN